MAKSKSKKRKERKAKAEVAKIKATSGSLSWKHDLKPVTKGMSRIERIKREPFYKGNGYYFKRDLGNANLKVLVTKVSNQKKGKLPFEHLCFN